MKDRKTNEREPVRLDRCTVTKSRAELNVNINKTMILTNGAYINVYECD